VQQFRHSAGLKPPTIQLIEKGGAAVRIDRRQFLAGFVMSLASATHAERWPNGLDAGKFPGPDSHQQDLDFASASQAAEAIRRKRISSVELVGRVFQRIEHFDSRLNAFVYQIKDEALAQARKADQAQARRQSLGPLHGVPVHVKECFAISGRPCTWGIANLRNVKAPRNSEAVDRLLGAGAVVVGATNVPLALADWQSYNEIYGTTNNPWDLKRTPGGSSGGSAAALAAGLGYLSVGSDIGGSIRVPSHFCGVYGHKPTLDLVSPQGMQPGGGWSDPGFSTLLAVAGPMARSAADLRTALIVLGGPQAVDAKAWSWKLPPPRSASLKGFRVGYVLDDPLAALAPDVKAVLEAFLHRLERSGVTLKAGWPAGFRPTELLNNYLFHLYAFLFSVSPPDQQEVQRRQFAGASGPIAEGSLSSFADWQKQNYRRLAFRAQWQAYFREVDVFLSPVAFSAAFPHDHSEPQDRRTIATANGPRRYTDMLNWISVATLTGCPSTVAPAGRTAEGLPVGLQIIGPYWEDDTPITFAELLEREVGGFNAPPGFSA
jgi:amidase